MSVVHFADDPNDTTAMTACGRYRVRAPWGGAATSSDPRLVACKPCLKWLEAHRPTLMQAMRGGTLLRDGVICPRCLYLVRPDHTC